MDALGMGVAVLACVFGGALGGMLIRRSLPEHHLAKATEDAVKLGTGMIATMSALVLGLLLASAKGAFDTKDGEIKHFSTDLILLDRNLERYGPEVKEARDLLRRYTVYQIDSTWPDEASQPPEDGNGGTLLEKVQDRVRALAPGNDGQRWLQARALQISGDLSETRWLVHVQMGNPIAQPFLVILVFWLSIVFVNFGLFAPSNGTAIAVLFVCAFSIAGAIFLILEMAHPFRGLIVVSSGPMREALALLGH